MPLTATPLERGATALSIALLVTACAGPRVNPTGPSGADGIWTFAVSGDSRNCGNLVMPAIAADVQANGARFYWHLGDLRRISGVDEDFARERRFAAAAPTRREYIDTAWSDFRTHQVTPFGSVPFFIGIGNHETIPPKTREEFRAEFGDLLDRPELQAQRKLDGSPARSGAPTTYYHWTQGGVDFINLDNASDNSFDAEQLAWFDAVVAADLANPGNHTLVVGMHEALPHSLGDNHSMCDSANGVASGEHVYRRLFEAQGQRRHVYLLASHSHFYLANVFATAYWRDPAHGAGVLPGWIVGTAGAARNPLPAEVSAGPEARAHVYGYLKGTVHPGGEVSFAFKELGESDLERNRPADYTVDDVHFCYSQNPDPALVRLPPRTTCAHAAD